MPALFFSFFKISTTVEIQGKGRRLSQLGSRAALEKVGLRDLSGGGLCLGAQLLT